MKLKFPLILLFLFSSPAFSNGICLFTEQEKEFFEFTENYPFSDNAFSPENVAKSQKRQDAYNAGEKVEYFIPENTRNIIKGGKLQKSLREEKENFENYIPAGSTNWDRKKYDLKYEYLKARKNIVIFNDAITPLIDKPITSPCSRTQQSWAADAGR